MNIPLDQLPEQSRRSVEAYLEDQILDALGLLEDSAENDERNRGRIEACRDLLDELNPPDAAEKTAPQTYA
ncbi:hypothetical protein [Sneathiella sp.]|uniref:hypothetical protein n=1 Tax=Sneathiella sp. TaxID=1964365 RepID=UPI00356AA79C